MCLQNLLSFLIAMVATIYSGRRQMDIEHGNPIDVMASVEI